MRLVTSVLARDCVCAWVVTARSYPRSYDPGVESWGTHCFVGKDFIRQAQFLVQIRLQRKTKPHRRGGEEIA